MSQQKMKCMPGKGFPGAWLPLNEPKGEARAFPEPALDFYHISLRASNIKG